MLLPLPGLTHVNSITHEGKVLVFATDRSGTVWYTVRRDGFERAGEPGLGAAPERDSVANWEAFAPVSFSDQPADMSVIERERAELSYEEGGAQRQLLRSHYRSTALGAVAPVQLASFAGHLYLFRQSTSGTILVDRFVLDGMTNRLVRKLEVRFKRSRKRHEPEAPARESGRQVFDSLSYRDAQGELFYEPTIELWLIGGIERGEFAVLLLPTEDLDRHRWHFFVCQRHEGAKRLQSFSLMASKDGLFDLADGDGPAIIHRIFRLDAAVAGAPMATKYDLQKEADTKAGKQLLRTATRVMVAVPTEAGSTAVLDFGASVDGTLARVDESPASLQLRGERREVTLPLSTLDSIRALGTTTPAGGSVAGMARGRDDKIELRLAGAAALKPATRVAIADGPSLDGRYTARPEIIGTLVGARRSVSTRRSLRLLGSLAAPLVRGARLTVSDGGVAWSVTVSEDAAAGANVIAIAPVAIGAGNGAVVASADAFIAEPGSATRDLGTWQEVVPDDANVLFDGVITAVAPTEDGRLRVDALSHGLIDGDEVVITGMGDLNGVWPVTRLDADRFRLDAKWRDGVARNVKLESRKRRGIALTAAGDRVEIAHEEPRDGATCELWFRTAKESGGLLSFVDPEGKLPDRHLALEDGAVVARFAGPSALKTSALNLGDGKWHHVAHVLDDAKRHSIYVDGVLRAEAALTPASSEPARKRLLVGHASGLAEPGFEGQLAELRIWSRARTAKEIGDAMHLPLVGREPGLAGYWRLGAIIEGQPRRVADFSPGRNDGIVIGDAFVGARSLAATLADGAIKVARYLNDELFPVLAGKRYRESFEFRPSFVSGPSDQSNNAAMLALLGPKTNPIFAFDYRGKATREAEDWIRLEAPDARSEGFEYLGAGWFRANGSFVVPEESELTLMRSFGLGAVRAELFSEIEIRRHKIVCELGGITRESAIDDIALGAAATSSDPVNDALRVLARCDAQEPVLLAERDFWARMIADAEKGGDQARHKSLVDTEIPAARGARDAAQARYAFETDNPANFWCWFSPQDPSESHRNLKSRLADIASPVLMPVLASLRASGVLGAVFTEDTSARGVQLWRFVAEDAGAYRLTTRSAQENGALLAIPAGVFLVDAATATSAMATTVSPPATRAEMTTRMRWRPVKLSGRVYAIQNLHDQRFLACGLQFAFLVDSSASPEARWVAHLGEVADQAAIDAARGAYEASRQVLSDKEAEAQRLEAALAAGAQDIARWRERLAAITTSLDALYREMAAAQATATAGDRPRASMNELHADARGLAIAGAALPFVDAASRLTIAETSEGNVQLSFVDRDGRMRLSRYDATLDSRNDAYQQWLPDKLRRCLELDERSIIRLTKPLPLPAEYTLEVWFRYPFPGRASILAMNASSASIGDGHATPEIHAFVWNDRLGISLGSRDYTVDWDHSRLAAGWHHLAIVSKGERSTGTTVFYVDGVKIGDVKDQLVRRRAAELAAEEKRQDVGEPGSLDFKMHEDRIKYRKRDLDEAKQASMRVTGPIAFVGNARVFDGRYSTAVPVGRLAELRVWGAALGDEEIEINSKTDISGDEPGLLEWYKLDGDARAHLDHANDGVLQDLDGADRDAPTAWKAWIAPIGHPGHAVLRFDGANDQLVLPAAFDLPESGTLEFWFRPAPRASSGVGAAPQPQNLFIADGPAGRFRMSTEIVIEPAASGSPASVRRRIALELAAGAIEVHLPVDGAWHHVSIEWDFLGATAARLTLDGSLRAKATIAPLAQRPILRTLAFARDGAGGASFDGWLAELRIWSGKRASATTSSDMRRRLDGSEPGLLGYWPLSRLDAIPANAREREAANLVPGGKPAIALEASLVVDNTLPMAADALVTSEYVSYGLDPKTNARNALMRRFLAVPASGGVALLAQKRVEALELVWVGNAQFKPTLLGYIEGPPPVPSENLTIDPPVYNGGTAVELTVDEEVSFAWNRDQQWGLGFDLSVFLGAERKFGPFGESKAGARVNLDFGYKFLNTSDVAARATSNMVDRLELRGAPEETPQFPHLGRRFVPKNIGYALVVSGLADVFVTRLARSGRMVSYHLQPTPDIPLDVNTITFLINPAYTLNGSLDGLVGTRAADERFFKHVPEMRAQYGAVYPASYYRLHDAYDRKAAIEKADQERATYFVNFNAGLVDEGSVERNIDVDDDKDAQKARAEAESERVAETRESYENKVHSSTAFANWQRKLEDLQVKAGKRNIVNTYVWDADGGSHVESEQFATTIEHTIGSSIELNGKVGFEGALQLLAFKGELTALATFNLTQTMTKKESRSRSMALNVELTEVERLGVTDHEDRPYLPGEKVDRYRFMSFFLEGATTHFEDFFAEVVDPEWLASNDEEARALRQVDRSKPNRTWRIMHRVTYVERPALMGFGRDTRSLADDQKFFTEFGPLQEAVLDLKRDIAELRGKLDAALASGVGGLFGSRAAPRAPAPRKRRR